MQPHSPDGPAAPDLTQLENGDMVLREQPLLLLRSRRILTLVVSRVDQAPLQRGSEWSITQLVTERIKPHAFDSLKTVRSHPRAAEGALVLAGDGGDHSAIAELLTQSTLK